MNKDEGIDRRRFGSLAAGFGWAIKSNIAEAAPAPVADEILPGIWKIRFGVPEKLTPVTQRSYPVAQEALQRMSKLSGPPLQPDQIAGKPSHRGYHLRHPLAAGEMIYGLGLQFQSVMQRGRKKTLRVNADPVADSGDSHAPVPFYVSNRGYGVFIDTARYLTIYCGNKVPRLASPATPIDDTPTANAASVLPPSYGRFKANEASEALIEVPEAEGVDVYIFGGPTLRDVVCRYNLFSGGGPLPPRWGLGFWYRAYGEANDQEILKLATDLRQENIPCDVLGFEPGWQTHAYSCSFKWSDKFPHANQSIATLAEHNYRVNLWEHAFTHPSSPIHKNLLPYSGDYLVWDGLVPDFLHPKAQEIFGKYHDQTFVANGVAGFKLDECDNSDFTRSWSFPELSSFPSGADGEQMHCFFGLRYQDTIQNGYRKRNLRTLGLVRSSHALAAPSPYVLYSDLYDHREFIRGVVNAGFSGLLWCPEVRDAKDDEDLVRRLQTTVFSPLAMVNAWYIRNPPWKQVNRTENNAGRLAEGYRSLQSICQKLIELRMQLVPYLYSAYVRYHQSGIPPFRALVVDYPNDSRTFTIDDQYMMGEDLLVAPVVAGEGKRDVYLPAGTWFDFWTAKPVQGGRSISVEVPLEQIPVFVKGGTLLPLAEPTLHTADKLSRSLTIRAYGQGNLRTILYEDDGTLTAQLHELTISWSEGQERGVLSRGILPTSVPTYSVERWERAVPSNKA